MKWPFRMSARDRVKYHRHGSFSWQGRTGAVEFYCERCSFWVVVRDEEWR